MGWAQAGPGPCKMCILPMYMYRFLYMYRYDGRVHFPVFLDKSTVCYINGHYKQYILEDTIFNYIAHLELPRTCL